MKDTNNIAGFLILLFFQKPFLVLENGFFISSIFDIEVRYLCFYTNIANGKSSKIKNVDIFINKKHFYRFFFDFFFIPLTAKKCCRSIREITFGFVIIIRIYLT